MSTAERFTREDLRKIAAHQKGIMMCVLLYLALVVAQFAIPEESRLVLALIAVPIVLTGMVFVILLVARMYTTGMAVLLAILTLIPLVGLIVLLIVNGKATGLLNAHGIKVGFLGANSSQIR